MVHKGDGNPVLYCLADLDMPYAYLKNSNLWPTGTYQLLGVTKVSGMSWNMVKIVKKTNLLVHTAYENISVDKAWGENKLQELSFHFDFIFPLNGHRDFYRQVWANYPSFEWQSYVDNFYDAYDNCTKIYVK